MINIENRLYNTLTLACAFSAGSVKSARIYEALCRDGCINLPFGEFVKCDCIDDKLRERLDAVQSVTGKVLKQCERENIRILPAFDDCFPECLRNIPVPPVILYTKGELPDFDRVPAFCIVGPRKVSDFGKKAAYSLSRRLSKAGFTVVSGAAVGADTAAHLGAVSVGGKSVMVSARGIAAELNSGDRSLCAKILENGCIISENPPYSQASKFSFPVRNRLMSGLSLGVAVVEAPEKSGALITASHAAEQGKDVFVIPGSPADKAYKGSNALLRDGAIPLLDASDVFSKYIFDFPEQIDIKKAFSGEANKELKKNSQKKSLAGLSKEAGLVYNNIVKPEFTVDDLSAADVSGSALLSALTELEMEHLIVSLPGGIYKISD